MSLINLGSNGSLALTQEEKRIIHLKRELGKTHPDVIAAEKYIEALKAQTRVPTELLPYTKLEKTLAITTGWGKIVKAGVITFAILFLFIGGMTAFEAIFAFVADNLLISGIVFVILAILLTRR